MGNYYENVPPEETLLWDGREWRIELEEGRPLGFIGTFLAAGSLARAMLLLRNKTSSDELSP